MGLILAILALLGVKPVAAFEGFGLFQAFGRRRHGSWRVQPDGALVIRDLPEHRDCTHGPPFQTAIRVHNKGVRRLRVGSNVVLRK